MSLPFPFPTKPTKDSEIKNENPTVNNNFLNKPCISHQYLNSEERWEIYQVKAAERPNLLHYQETNGIDTKEEEKSILTDPPLIDGCDIPGWRKEKIVPISKSLEAILNIGPGADCSYYGNGYFKRERQWDIFRYNTNYCILNNDDWCWLNFKNTIMNVDPNVFRNITSIDYNDACAILDESGRYDSNAIDDNKNKYHGKQEPTRFAMEYENKNVPVKVLNATKGWKATESKDTLWTFSNFLRRFSTIKFRFSDLHGEMLELQTYHKYINNVEGLTDDSPLAIYDSEFATIDDSLINEYDVPKCFSYDLFNVLDDQDRPPYRWILIGPERSGTGMHIDPLHTNAWVTILQGKKRWMLFPPSTPSKDIGMMNDDDNGLEVSNTLPSIIWFKNYYKKVTSNDWPECYKPIEVLQNAGETVFIPQGWKHVVLNLELTLAVTHNYISEYSNLKWVWDDMQENEPTFGKLWHERMIEVRPDLVEKYFQS